MSVKQQVDDAIYSALDASTGISKVSRSIEAWYTHSPDDFPSVCFMGGPDERSRLAYPHATSKDMQCVYPFRIFGVVQKIGSSSRIDEKRSELAEAIEKAIVGSTALDDLVADVTLATLTVDDGGLENNNVGLIYCDFISMYFYNHNNP